MAIDGEDAGALEAKGIALFRAGHVDEARPLFEHAASAAPWTSASHVALAAIALHSRDRDAAIAHLEAAREVEPGDAWVLDRLAEVYAVKGDQAHAEDIRRSREGLGSIGRAPSVTDASSWLPGGWR